MINMDLHRSSPALIQMHKVRLELVVADFKVSQDLVVLVSELVVVVAKQTCLSNFSEVHLGVEVGVRLLVSGRAYEEMTLKQAWESVSWRLAKAPFGTSISPQW